jgi:hypothetical protein
MNLRHATALALVGWYLMVPPSIGPHPRGGEVLRGAPLREWEQEAAFDTAKECRDAQDRDLADMAEAATKAKHQVPPPTQQRLHEIDNMWIQTSLGRCVATDDPRLKETK